MKIDDEVLKIAIESATALSLAQEESRRAQNKLFLTVETAPDADLWEFVSSLARRLEKCESPRHEVKRAVDNVLWEFMDRGEWTVDAWEKAASAVAAYERLCSRLAHAADAMPDMDLGSDSFGDLIDALPLVGENVCYRVLSKDVASHLRLIDVVKAEASPKIADLVLRGESYFRLTMHEKLEFFFLSVARRLKRAEEC